MKHKFLLALLLIAGTGLFAQTETKKIVGNDPLLMQITTLSTLAGNVNSAYAGVQAAATSSRSRGADAQSQLDAAYAAYLAELQNQLKLNAGNADLTAAIQKEIDLVNKLQTGK